MRCEQTAVSYTHLKSFMPALKEEHHMGLAIPIETSARHIHMCRSDFEALFGTGAELTYKADLSQPGQFVAQERLTIQGPKGSFENVAILGPFRK